MSVHVLLSFFFFNVTPPTLFYTLSLHDALPDSLGAVLGRFHLHATAGEFPFQHPAEPRLVIDDQNHQRLVFRRSEEHTSELQSLTNLVCRLLLEKKKTINIQLSLIETNLL